MRSVRFGAILLTCGLTGCAIHPDTQDFSRDMMADIVFHVQCEAQRAIDEALEDEKLYPALTLLSEKDPHAFGRVNSYSAFVSGFRTHLLNTVLDFNFKFTLTEVDDLTTDGSVRIPISLGSFTIGWDAGVEKQRETTQTVQFQDTFNELLALDCEHESRRRNFVYPITGNVGLQDTFNNFVRISARQVGKEVLTYSDGIEFITDLAGKLSPSINLVPKAGRLITANVNAVVARTDAHNVTLTFSQFYTPKQLSDKKAKSARDAADLEQNQIALAVAIAQKTHKIARRVQLVDHTGNKAIDLTSPAGPRPPVDQNRRIQEFGLSPGTGKGTPRVIIQNTPPAFNTNDLPRARTARPQRVRQPTEAELIAEAKRAARDEARRLESLNLNRQLLDELRN